MRVQGNASPSTVTVESYWPMPGYAEIRLHENIKDITPTDVENPTPLFEYDEYVIHVKEKDGLQAEIESNLADWLMTGRMLEVNENASVVQDMRTEIKNAVSTGDLEAAYKEGVNSV